MSVTGNTLTMTYPDYTYIAQLNKRIASWEGFYASGVPGFMHSHSEKGSGTFTATTFDATTSWMDRAPAGQSCEGTSKITGVKTSSSTITGSGNSPDVLMVYVVYDDNSVEIVRYRSERAIPSIKRSPHLKQ